MCTLNLNDYIRLDIISLYDRFPGDRIKKLADLGFMGINVSKNFGGSGWDTLSTSIIVEELSKGCASTGIVVAIHNCLYASLLDARGTDQQKEEFLRPFTSGSIGAFALSEYGSFCVAH